MERSSSPQLAGASLKVLKYPYQPCSWLERAQILLDLQYPELAVGDAHKAILLCQSHSQDRRSTLRFGYQYGFLIEDKDDHNASLVRETEQQRCAVLRIEHEARRLLESICTADIEELVCSYRPLEYNWGCIEHKTRSDALISNINKEFFEVRQMERREPSCEVRRYAFGTGLGSAAGLEELGVFSTRHVQEGEIVLVDRSQIWGYRSMHRKTLDKISDKKCDQKTASSSHGIQPWANEHDLTCGIEGLIEALGTDSGVRSWSRCLAAPDTTDLVMKCRAILQAVHEPGISHPLDHPVLARLVPSPACDVLRTVHYTNDIEIPTTLLQRSGIDIFANPSYDTWVLLTIFARIDNNAWSNGAGTAAGVGPLFALFNHSCEPNLHWSPRKREPGVVEVVAARDVKPGEQLFVEYNKFLRDSALSERRKGLWRWLGAICQCERCVREEVLESCTESSRKVAVWDLETRPILPEEQHKIAGSVC